MAVHARFLRLPRRQLSLSAVAVALVTAAVWCVGLELIEPLRTGIVPEDPEAKRNLINALSRASVTLIGAIFSCLFLAVPLTASMYTPQLIPIFVRSNTNRFVLSFFVLSAANSIWTASLSPRDGHEIRLGITFVTVSLSLILLLPYLFSVFRLLDPFTIISRVHDEILKDMRPRPNDIAARREHLSLRIRNLGNIALRTLERSDRDISLAAVEALGSCAQHYLDVKKRHGDDWFRVDADHFPGFASAAIAEVNAKRTFVEMELLRQFARAYDAALARVPDVISAIGRCQRHFAIAAARRGEEGALELAVRYFNNYLREAVKRGDIHAIFDLLYQYRELGERLFETRPDMAAEIARRLVYYGRASLERDLPFGADLVAYDLGRMITDGARVGIDIAPLFEPWLAFDCGRDGKNRRRFSAGMLKARLLVEARLRAAGRGDLADRVAASLAGADRPPVAVVAGDLASTAPESFWEVTDRQENLDHCEAEARPQLDAALDRLRAEEKER